MAIAKGVKALLKGAGVPPTGVTVVRDEVRVVLSRAAAVAPLVDGGGGRRAERAVRSAVGSEVPDATFP